MVLTVLLGSCPPGADAAAPTHPPSQHAVIPAKSDGQAGVHSRILRGDWEPASTLLIAYEQIWYRELGELAAAARGEAHVIVVVRPEDAESPFTQHWLRENGLQSLVLGYDTWWIRDYGPFEVRDNGALRWVDLVYSFDRSADDVLPQSLGDATEMGVERYGLSLEGGGLISNGQGLCAMTRVSYDRFAPLSALDLVAHTLVRMGCHWLTVVPALTEEATGHIDMIAQFLSPTMLALAEVDANARPDDAAVLDEAEALLRAGAQHLGTELEVVRVPLVVRGTTHYSYINGTRLRSTFLVPAYQDVPIHVQRLAYERLHRGLPPEVQLVPVLADDLAKLGGAVHCVTLGLGVKVPRNARQGDATWPWSSWIKDVSPTSVLPVHAARVAGPS